MPNILFICTSNKDRSVALQEYFSFNYPDNCYQSAGINGYYTKKKNTHFLTKEDIDWADLIVFAEEIHERITKKWHVIKPATKTIVLNCGNYDPSDMDTYVIKAESILTSIYPQVFIKGIITNRVYI